MQFVVPESLLWFYHIGTVGFIISLLFFILFLLRKEFSDVARTYMGGAATTFFVGGFTVTYAFIFPMCPCEVYWTSPFGLIGGYALIVVAFVQVWFDRNMSTSHLQSESK